MENNNKVKLSNFMFFTIRKTKSKDRNSTNVSGSNSSEKSDDKYLSEEEKCSISTHNRTHRLCRSIKDKFKKNKFTICKGKQKVTACENKTNRTAFDGEESDVESKDFTILPAFTPPLVPPRQRSTLLTDNDTHPQNLFLNDCQWLDSNLDDISLTACSYNHGNTSDMQFLQKNRYSTTNNFSIVAQTSTTQQNGLPLQNTDDIFNKNTYIDILDFDSSSNIENVSL